MMKHILVPIGHGPFGQHQESCSLGVQNQKSVIPRLPIKSDKSDRLSLLNSYSANAKIVRSGQRLCFLVQTQREATSGDENE